MIKLKIKSFHSDSSDIIVPYKENELLNCLVTRVLEENDLKNKEEYFHVLLNGHNIDKDFWNTIQLKETDSVLIAPKIKEGSFGDFLKLAAVILVTVYTGGAATAAGYSSFASGMIAAGASIATSLALNAIFPPPEIDLGSIPASASSSQMYSITSQSNTAKKYGGVPKVYGVHRIFPTIAANPYTELETDITSGELVQFYYCVYDLGYGPMYVDDIRIGDTPLLNFSDMEYSLVDFNRPTTPEGDWDNNLKNSLTYYKGDVEFDNTTVTLDDNEISGGPLSGYQAIRESAVNSDGVSQEITLSFLNPQGLIAYGTNGDTFNRNIEMEIQFSKVGEDNWKNCNDLDFVKNFKGVGGSDSTIDTSLTIPAFSATSGIYSQLTPDEQTKIVSGRNGQNSTISSKATWGIPKGATYIIALDSELSIGRYVFWNGNNLGQIASITTSGITGYSKYYFTVPTTFLIELFTVTKIRSYYNDVLQNTNYSVDGQNANKLFKKAEGKFVISRKDTGQVYSTVKFTPKENGQFKVRVTRVKTTSSATFRTQDSLIWASIRTRFDRSPIVTDKRHTFLELKIRATNQLNGAIQNLSAVCTSVLDVWDGTQWIKQPTNNPAWIFADLLTGEINKRSIPKNRLHVDSLLEWADYCDEIPDSPTGQTFNLPRFTSNFVIDFDTTLQSILNQVANACQASLNIIDGKYGVLVDKLKTTPVQIFTPRNSSNFASTKNYSIRPDALKVKFIDPNSSWDINEKIVYDDGINELNALTFEEISTFGCIDSDQAWRFGRYMLAQNRLRQETINITVDFEYLVCTRGDYVQITQDVMKVGGTPARVKTVAGNIITIDEGIESLEVPYGYVARGVDGIVTSTLTILNSDTFELDGTIPAVGDLIVIGEVGSIVFDCIVKAISPNDELSATLTLVEKSDAIYLAESTDVLPNYSPYISNTANAQFVPPKEVENLTVTENSWTCGANSFEHFIHIDWDSPIGSAYEFFEIYVDSGKGYNIVGTTRFSEYVYYVESDRVGFEHKFKILPVSATGKKLELAAVTYLSTVPYKKISNVADVNRVAVNITGETLTLDWDAPIDCIKEYVIRYSPSINGNWANSVSLLKTDKNTTLASVQARTGTYLIKAIDYNGNESLNPALAVTTIPELFNLNIIETITDSPTMQGTTDRVEILSNGCLILQKEYDGSPAETAFYSEGYYYLNSILDLGEIYTVRLQSNISATGYALNEIINSWDTLSDITSMYNVKYSDWDVHLEYSTTDSISPVSAWITLSSITTLSQGSSSVWSEFRKFIMGDGTGRIFKFRLKLSSYRADISPSVGWASIKADMPDRIDSYTNLVSSATNGYTLTYDKPFKGPGSSPNIQITVEDFQTGDYWTYDYKTLDGFKISFYDKNNTKVSRIFDVQVKGYGRKNIITL